MLNKEELVGVRLVGVLRARSTRKWVSGWRVLGNWRIILLVRVRCFFHWCRWRCRSAGRRGVWMRRTRASENGGRLRRRGPNDVGRGGAKGVRRRARLTARGRGRMRVSATRKFDGSLVSYRLHKNSRGGGCVVDLLPDVTSLGGAPGGGLRGR
jgi:hypothetical protein